MKPVFKFLFLLLIIGFIGCKNESSIKKHKFTNALVNETSPYLLQHAHNPVNWNAWNSEAFEQAKEQN